MKKNIFLITITGISIGVYMSGGDYYGVEGIGQIEPYMSDGLNVPAINPAGALDPEGYIAYYRNDVTSRIDSSVSSTREASKCGDNTVRVGDSGDCRCIKTGPYGMYLPLERKKVGIQVWGNWVQGGNAGLTTFYLWSCSLKPGGQTERDKAIERSLNDGYALVGGADDRVVQCGAGTIRNPDNTCRCADSSQQLYLFQDESKDFQGGHLHKEYWVCISPAPTSFTPAANFTAMKAGGSIYYADGTPVCPEVVSSLGGNKGGVFPPAQDVTDLLQRFEGFNSKCSVLNHDAFRQQFCDFVLQDAQKDKSFYQKRVGYDLRKFKEICGRDLPQ